MGAGREGGEGEGAQIFPKQGLIKSLRFGLIWAPPLLPSPPTPMKLAFESNSPGHIPAIRVLARPTRQLPSRPRWCRRPARAPWRRWGCRCKRQRWAPRREDLFFSGRTGGHAFSSFFFCWLFVLCFSCRKKGRMGSNSGSGVGVPPVGTWCRQAPLNGDRE